MRKISYFLVAVVSIIHFSIVSVFAEEVPVISNLRIEFSPGAATGIASVKFKWNTYGAPSYSSGTLTPNNTTTTSPTGASTCDGDNSVQGNTSTYVTTHCYSFTNLIVGRSYHYSVSSTNSVGTSSTQQGYSSGDFDAQSSGTLTPGATYSFTLVPNQTSGIVAKGHSVSYIFTLQNTGNTNDTVTLSLPTDIPSAWNATLSPSTFNNFAVNQSSNNTAVLTLTPNLNNLSTLVTRIQIASTNGFSGNSDSVNTSIDAPPSAPTSLSASALSTSSIRLTWLASTDNSGAGVAGYEIYNDSTGNFIAATSTTTYDHTGLTASTQYRYKVRAYDNNSNPKNYSEFSSVASATTLASSSTPNATTPPPSPQPSPSPSPSPSPVPPSTTPPSPQPSTINEEITSNIPVLLQGKVVYPDGSAASGALISIWANNATASATAGSNGEFSFQIVRNTTWRLSAAKTLGTTGYKSNDITVSVGNATVSDVNISLAVTSVFVPPPTVTQRPVTERITTILTNGAAIDIPPSSVSASGNVTLDVRPTVEAHEYFTSQVIGLAYDIVIRNEAGVEVKTFAQPFDLTFPFDDTTLINLGVGADNLVPSFYNEVTRQWVPLTTFTIDKVNKRVIAKVSHLTRFALIAAADVTAPTSPTLVTATKTSGGVVIRWVNPASDFRHAKIYRSTENGKLGTVLFGEVAGTTQIDTSAAAGATYYYVVRSVDPAGNESTNTAQVAVGASASGTASGAVSTSGLRRYLRVGMSGVDVKLIQQIMVKEGVYIEGFTTGNFGLLTQKAVIKFQDKYRAEILTPVGLTAGNGYVGPKTLQKFIELKAKHSL